MIACYAGFAIVLRLLLLAALCISARTACRSVLPIYAVLVLLGVVRSFNGPVSRAILPQLVPEEHFQNAVAWHSTVFQARRFWGRRSAD